MTREFRVISALEATDVPVPKVHGLCTDLSVLGVPFYVMERVGGQPYRHASQLAQLGPTRTRTIAMGLIDTLATLHAVDPFAIGLADFGRPQGFLTRQLNRWRKQLMSSYTRELPAADELYSRLSDIVPPDTTAGIVHGDYRLDNVLVNDTDRPVAVIDWEMVTLGDPLTDLALMIVYGRLGDTLPNTSVVDAASAPGFLSESEIVERYATHGLRDLSQFGFYIGLASFKLAAISEGIHFRYLQGQTVGEGFAEAGVVVELLLEAGLAALAQRG